MIGTKFYKSKYIQEEYAQCANWCNETQLATIEDKGEYYECVEIPAPRLDELKAQKLTELKNIRDTEEVEPISYQGNRYDYDDKARDRINAAIIALNISGQSIEWTTADNTNVAVTAQDLRNIIAAVALRSNALHVKYRNLKEQVLACTTAEEVAEIVW